ncbi:MAG: ribose 5-phosphate isomerase B [Chloroflexota bacterium]|nr:ribose 5-phosphate isomerase B [Chloroflexota bacterium]
MRIAVGSDHRGYNLKEEVKRTLIELGHEPVDYGCGDTTSVDYPDYAQAVARAVAARECELGVLVCGTGIGMSITANKAPGVRAAVCTDLFTAQRARQHNDANVLCLGADVLGTPLALEVLRVYLSASFEGGRHTRRVDKINSLDSRPGARR